MIVYLSLWCVFPAGHSPAGWKWRPNAYRGTCSTGPLCTSWPIDSHKQKPKPSVSACADENARNKIMQIVCTKRAHEHFVPQKQFAQKVGEVRIKRNRLMYKKRLLLFLRWLRFWGTNLGRQSSPAAVCSPPRCRWRRDACRGSGSSD